MREEATTSAEPADDLAQKLTALGEPIATFTVGGWRPILHLVAAPVSFALGLALAVGPFFLLHRIRAGLVKVALLGLFLIAAGVVLATRAVRYWKCQVLVYPEGLIYFRRGRTEALFWDQVQSLWRKQSEGHWSWFVESSLVYSVEQAGGPTVDFTNYLPGIEALGAILERETLPHLLPPALQAYHQGVELLFGPIALSQEGWTNGKETLPWDQVQEIKYDDNQLTITRREKGRQWFAVSLSQIPNYHVLRHIVTLTRGTTKPTADEGVEP